LCGSLNGYRHLSFWGFCWLLFLVVCQAHYKFTKWWLTTSHADRQKRDRVYESLHNQYAQPTYHIILHLRGLYVKMGQILSSRPDFMPYQYIQYFTDLQDNIPSYDTELVQNAAIQALQKDCPAYHNYENLVLDPIPLGSASIGQVHRATLKYNTKNMPSKTKEVAVKVMHRDVKRKFQTDFQVFRWLCRIAIPSWCHMLNALEQQVMTEFNYLHEAQSLQTVRNNALQSPYRYRVCIPQPMLELCCEQVLVMEMLHGKKLIDSIREKLVNAFGGNHNLTHEFLQQRKYEVFMGTRGGRDATSDGNVTTTITRTSNEIIRTGVHLVGKLKLFLLFQQCRHAIDLLVDVHGYQIFRTGTC
jgi:aarF domain-containing kinase